jgi:hypothetical protein
MTLHAHLKRGLDHDDFYLDPADIVEDVPREYRDPEEQAAKRQRIEKIAAQCLQGKLPVILTASLRGPFSDGWKNPWAKPRKTRRRVSDKENSVGSNKNGIGGRAGVRKAKPVEVKRRTRSAGRRALEVQTVASPETSRAVHSHIEEFQEKHTQDLIEVPPATAPSPEEHDTSGATEFFSLDTERCVRRQSPLTDPFWLRRPESQRKADMRTSNKGSTDASPTHTRGGLAQPDRIRPLQLAVPKVAVGFRPPQVKRAVSEDISSSASASMVISSPVRPAVPTYIAVSRTSASRRQRSSTRPLQTPGPTSNMQPAQAQSAATPSSILVPATNHKTLSADQFQSNNHMTKADRHSSATQERSQEGPSREVIQRSAERLSDVLSASHSSNSQTKPVDQAGPKPDKGPRQSQDSHVAPPIPNSSTGFVYKKVGSTKWSISNAPRSKPRTVNFNSSPATKDPGSTSKPGSQKLTPVEKAAPAKQVAQAGEGSQPEGQTSGSQANEPVLEQQSLRSSRSSRHSAMSTQAAMLLAQLEFQESTFPTLSSETPRPWSQPQEDTPRPMLPEPSPAITPLSVFRPQLEQAHPLASVLRGPLLSTQDLFAAASPFAFSTVKKKPEAPQHSNLRMSLVSFDGHDVSNISPQSPSYSDRIPLKEKNAVPSPWRFSFERQPRKSPDSFRGSARRSISDVELPQLDFHTSLDEYGPTGSLHFADHLLRTMNDT